MTNYITQTTSENPYAYTEPTVDILNHFNKNWLRIPVSDVVTIGELKEFIKKEVNPIEEFAIFNGREEMTAEKDSHLFDKYLIQERPWIIMPRSQLPKQLDIRGITFTSMENSTTLTINSYLPKWAQVARGLCLEGKCTNAECEGSYSKTNGFVVMPVGYKTFDSLYDRCECPLCKTRVEPITFSVNNCYWSSLSVANGIVERKKGMSVFDEHIRFSGNIPDLVSRDRLVIFVSRQKSSNDVCCICSEDFTTGAKKVRYNRMFHDFCICNYPYLFNK